MEEGNGNNQSSEHLFEIREYIDEEGHEIGKNEVVDVTKQLDYVQNMATNKDKDEEQTESQQLNLQPIPPQSEESTFISEISKLADESAANPDDSDILEVLEKIELRSNKVAGSRDRIEGSGWKKGFFGK